MRHITIDLPRAVAGLRSIVERFGENHVPSNPAGGAGCIYATIRDGALVPVCIVGQFVADLGFLGALLQPVADDDEYAVDFVLSQRSDTYSGTPRTEPEQQGACVPSGVVWDALSEHGLHFTDDAKRYLRDVQAEQDASTPWGRAVEGALRAAHDRAVRALPTASLIRPEQDDDVSVWN